MTLAEALEQVELEAGRTYRCRVNDKSVTVSVSTVEDAFLADPIREEDIVVMRDPPFELAEPKPYAIVKARPGGNFMPDIPEIPPDGDAKYAL